MSTPGGGGHNPPPPGPAGYLQRKRKASSNKAMDSYVVRIYRRAGWKFRVLIGTVEVAGTEKKMVFSNIGELWEILRRRKRKGELGKPHLPKPEDCPASLGAGTQKKEGSVSGQINRVMNS